MEKGRAGLMGTYDVALELPKRRLVIPRQLREEFAARNPEGTKFKIESGTLEGVPMVLLYDSAPEKKTLLAQSTSYLTREGSLEHRLSDSGRLLIPQSAATLLGNESLTLIGCVDYLELVRTRDYAKLTESPGDNVDRARAFWLGGK